MYRRRRYRRRTVRKSIKSIQHITNVNAQSPATVTSTTHIFANAGNYATTGTASTTIYGALSNREQENTIGNHIGKTNITINFRAPSASGVFEIVVWKRERQSAVPTPGTGMPTDAVMNTRGCQTAFREEMPGRVVYFDSIAVAPEQPRVKHISIPWAKFRMSKIRTGDFYGITIFNRTTGSIFIDIYTRYKEYT